MKKTIVLSCMTVLAACAFMTYGWESTEDTPDHRNTMSHDTPESLKSNTKQGKVLVTYFSVPETDGVDASSGASRVSAGGNIMGNTQYVASIISEMTGGELFEIKRLA